MPAAPPTESPPRLTAAVVVAPAPAARPAAGAFTWLTRPHTLYALLGVAVLGWWASWWVGNLRKNRLQKSPASWFKPHDFLGLDFLHNYHAARHWAAGGDPYREPFGDPLGRRLCYPPAVLPFFAWCRACSPGTAVAIWTAALAAFAAAGTVAAWRSRRELGLAPVPLPFALAAVLTSLPVAFAMERGNYDLLVLPPVLAAAWALRERTLGRDALAGGCLALAACFKVYPALLIAGLIPLRRGRAAGFALLAGLACASFQAHNLRIFAANLSELAKAHDPAGWNRLFVLPLTHSIPLNWELLWEGTKLEFLARVPGPLAAAAILGSLGLWVGYRVYRCPDPRRLLVPYFLWVLAAATFAPKVSNDYNLAFLPLAALAVWDRRDPVPVQVGLGLMFVWAQPISFGVSPSVALAMKVAALVCTAACLAARGREQAAPGGP